jgi:hypothetical protein
MSAQKVITSEKFSQLLSVKFPVLRKILQKAAGDPYRTASRFAEFVNDAIRSGDSATIDQAMALAEGVYAAADDVVKNAFLCDFFEVLDLDSERGAKVFRAMSTNFQQLYRRAEDYISQ